MMLRRKKGWIGIDLGTHTLKIAQVERSAAGLRIAASVVMRRARASWAEDTLAEVAERPGRDVRAALLTGTRFSGRRVACVLPMRLTDLRVLAIPPAAPAERRAMVAHELCSMFDGDEQSREFDYWETGPPAKANPSAPENLNVLSVPRKTVSQVLSDLSQAKLSCQIMDGLPFALARAVKLACAPEPSCLNGARNAPGNVPEAPIAAIDWGFTSATLCVVSGGTPLFTRHLRNCGFGRLAEAVGRAMGLSQDDALELLTNHGMPDPLSRNALSRDALSRDAKRREIQEMLAEVTSYRLNEMAEEIEKTISYLRMQYPGILPERLCLFGCGATVNNVPELLAEKVRLPIEVWGLPHCEGQGHDDSKNPPALLGTAVALSALAWT